MIRLSMGYPAAQAELAMLDARTRVSPLDALEPVADKATVAWLVDTVREVHVATAVRQYAVDLVRATRVSPELRLGASPRATLHLLRAAKGSAALDGREYVLPDDLQRLAGPVLAHRLLPTAAAHVGARTTTEIVAEIVDRVPLPDSDDARVTRLGRRP